MSSSSLSLTSPTPLPPPLRRENEIGEDGTVKMEGQTFQLAGSLNINGKMVTINALSLKDKHVRENVQTLVDNILQGLKKQIQDGGGYKNLSSLKVVREASGSYKVDTRLVKEMKEEGEMKGKAEAELKTNTPQWKLGEAQEKVKNCFEALTKTLQQWDKSTESFKKMDEEAARKLGTVNWSNLDLDLGRPEDTVSAYLDEIMTDSPPLAETEKQALAFKESRRILKRPENLLKYGKKAEEQAQYCAHLIKNLDGDGYSPSKADIDKLSTFYKGQKKLHSKAVQWNANGKHSDINAINQKWAEQLEKLKLKIIELQVKEGLRSAGESDGKVASSSVSSSVSSGEAERKSSSSVSSSVSASADSGAGDGGEVEVEDD